MRRNSSDRARGGHGGSSSAAPSAFNAGSGPAPPSGGGAGRMRSPRAFEIRRLAAEQLFASGGNGGARRAGTLGLAPPLPPPDARGEAGAGPTGGVLPSWLRSPPVSMTSLSDVGVDGGGHGLGLNSPEGGERRQQMQMPPRILRQRSSPVGSTLSKLAPLGGLAESTQPRVLGGAGGTGGALPSRSVASAPSADLRGMVRFGKHEVVLGSKGGGQPAQQPPQPQPRPTEGAAGPQGVPPHLSEAAPPPLSYTHTPSPPRQPSPFKSPRPGTRGHSRLRAASAGGTGVGSVADPSRTRRGVAAMRTAARAGRVDVLAAVLAEDRSLATAANEAAGIATPLFEAVAAGEKAAVALLLSQGADPNAGSGERGPPILHAAAWGECTILTLLVSHGADVRATDTWGYNALHYACEAGHATCVRTLMEHGGEGLLETRTRESKTPAMLCKDRDTRVALLGDLANSEDQAAEPPLSARVLRFAAKLATPREGATRPGADVGEDEDEALIGLFDGGLQATPQPEGQGNGEGVSAQGRTSASNGEASGSEGAGEGEDVVGGTRHRRAKSTHLRDIIKYVTERQKSEEESEMAQMQQEVSKQTSRRASLSVEEQTTSLRRTSLSVEVPDPAGSTPRPGRITPGPLYKTDAINAPDAMRAAGSVPVPSPELSQSTGDLAAEDGGESPTSRPSRVGGGSAPTAEQAAAAAKLLRDGDSRASTDIDWARGELLGEGAYGKVYQGLNTQTGQLMAVKEIAVSNVEGRGGMAAERLKSLASLEREIELYKRLRHRHIVRYIGMQRDEDNCNLHVFLEFVPGGSIASMLTRFGHFSEQLVRLYTRQLLLGLEYLHSRRVIHRGTTTGGIAKLRRARHPFLKAPPDRTARLFVLPLSHLVDLKGANVLIDGDGVVKLADFGASTAFEQTNLSHGFKSIRGSVYWMAPEVMKGTGYGRRADIWSVGCTVIEMITANHPWPELDNGWAAMFHIAKAGHGPPIPETCSEQCKSFLQQCFVVDPRRRATATDLLSHPFVANIPSVLSELESARSRKNLELSL